MIQLINTKKIIESIEKQMEIEKKGIELGQKIVKASDSPLVRNLMNTICMDSMKHQLYCQVMIDIFSGTNLLKRERGDMVDLMEEHIKLEEEMLKHLKKVIKETDHPFVKSLFREYENDEKRHHKLLQKLMNNYIKKQDDKDWRPVNPREVDFDPEKMINLGELLRIFEKILFET